MADRLDIIDPKRVELHKQIKAIRWGDYVQHGWVKIKISEGKPVLINVELSDRIN
jgi:hypothetical protein